MTDLRNFRSSYLEKVGIKGVEEKKSLEILLKEQPHDLNKLSQFCLRFPVPAAYRFILWKILLGILPPHQESHEFVHGQRKEQYSDLLEALQVMGRIHEMTPLPEIHLRMFLIEEGCLPFDESKLFQDKDNQIFVSMATSMLEVADDPVDVYWLSTSFYRKHYAASEFWNLMVDQVEKYINKEDSGLHAHLVKMRAYNMIPCKQWINSCYAGILPENSFERIWDKVVGGSVKILLYVAVSILLSLKRSLLGLKNSEDIHKYVSKIPPENGDIIVSKAIDLWQKYGSQLAPVAIKGDSPAQLQTPDLKKS